MSSNSRVQSASIAALMGITLLLGAQAASATHEVHHRYTVWGEIKYEDDTPAAGELVQLLIGNGEVIGEIETDARGRYRVVLHVHNEDLYKVFDMRVNDVTRKVRILFNPNDRQTERGQRVDLTVKRKAELDTSSVQPQ